MLEERILNAPFPRYHSKRTSVTRVTDNTLSPAVASPKFAGISELVTNTVMLLSCSYYIALWADICIEVGSHGVNITRLYYFRRQLRNYVNLSNYASISDEWLETNHSMMGKSSTCRVEELQGREFRHEICLLKAGAQGLIWMLLQTAAAVKNVRKWKWHVKDNM